MFLTKIKNLLKPLEKLEANRFLNNKMRASFQATLAPLKVSVALLVMEKIKAKAAKKNEPTLRLRYGLAQVALAIFLVFALTGISFPSNYSHNRGPAFSVSLAPTETSSDKSNALIGAPSKTVTPPTTPNKAIAAPKLKEKSKTRIFLEKSWKFILALWE
jgi:hypothetical protein